MDRKSEKLADLAAMFGDIDLDIIENVLEICEGKVNRTAEMLLKMKEDNEVNEKSEKGREAVLNKNFLELDEEPAPEKERIERKSVEEVVLENEKLEQEYMVEMQQAIAMSLEGKKSTGGKQSGNKSSLKVANEKKSQKIEVKKEIKAKESEVKLIMPSSPDEEVIQFIFNGSDFIRGESLLNN